MSLDIDPQRVMRVLLADGWHEVSPGTFDLDSYEYCKPRPEGVKEEYSDILHGGGASGICATGFVFEDGDGNQIEGSKVAGPLSSILAVRLFPL